MAGKDDDFFGDGSGSGESEETNLDDFFQPAVSKPEPESAPPSEQEEPQFPASTESVPEAQPFPEEAGEPQPAPEAPSAPPEQPAAAEPPIESLFPTEQGSEGYASEEDSDDLPEAVPADEGGGKPKKSRFSLKVPRVAIFVLVGILVGAIIGGGGYFGYRYFLAGSGIFGIGKKSAEAPPAMPGKKAAQPGDEMPSEPKGDKTAAAGGGEATPGEKKARPYEPKPLPKMPPVKSPPKGTWSVHLERLALETSVAKDAQVVRKMGFTPFRAPENRSTRVTEFRVTAEYSGEDDANSAAWKIDDMGYRPRIKKSGGTYRIDVAVTYSAKDAGEIRRKLDSGGVKNVKVHKSRETKQLQALRVGPFKTKSEAGKAAGKLKRNGFAHAMVMKN